MTIAQALKEKNKKVARIQKLWDRINRYNSVQEGAERPYEITDLFNQVEAETAALVALKTRIHTVSEPIRESIFELSELKNLAQRVKSLNTTQGVYRDRYDSTSSIMTAALDIKWQDTTLEEIEAKIEKIQERLDNFNHTREI
jgi:DNA repair exonuclease SbcCD ATPase subunit